MKRFITVFILIFLGFGFIHGNFNPMEWDQPLRVISLLTGVTVAGFFAALE